MRGDCNENQDKIKKDLEALKIGFKDAKNKYFQMEQEKHSNDLSRGQSWKAQLSTKHRSN